MGVLVIGLFKVEVDGLLCLNLVVSSLLVICWEVILVMVVFLCLVLGFVFGVVDLCMGI